MLLTFTSAVAAANRGRAAQAQDFDTVEHRALQEGSVDRGRDRDAGDVKNPRPDEASSSLDHLPPRPENWDQMARVARKHWTQRENKKRKKQ